MNKVNPFKFTSNSARAINSFTENLANKKKYRYKQNDKQYIQLYSLTTKCFINEVKFFFRDKTFHDCHSGLFNSRKNTFSAQDEHSIII